MAYLETLRGAKNSDHGKYHPALFCLGQASLGVLCSVLHTSAEKRHG